MGQNKRGFVSLAIPAMEALLAIVIRGSTWLTFLLPRPAGWDKEHGAQQAFAALGMDISMAGKHGDFVSFVSPGRTRPHLEQRDSATP